MNGGSGGAFDKVVDGALRDEVGVAYFCIGDVAEIRADDIGEGDFGDDPYEGAVFVEFRGACQFCAGFDFDEGVSYWCINRISRTNSKLGI